MRRVKFPFELDATELMTDELRTKIRPLNVRFREIEKDRTERKRVAKRTKRDNNEDVGDDWMTEDEKKKRAQELEELEKLIDPEIKNDIGACASGVYDLQAILTHKGSDANSGMSMLDNYNVSVRPLTYCKLRSLHGLLSQYEQGRKLVQ